MTVARRPALNLRMDEKQRALIQSPSSQISQSNSDSFTLEAASELDSLELDTVLCCSPVQVSLEGAEDFQINSNSSKNVQENTDSCLSSLVLKHFTATAEEELDSQISLELFPPTNCGASEESERRSNQESELACLHGVQKRYQDAPQLDDMPLPVQEEHPGTSLCVMSERHYLFSCTLKAV